MVKVSRSVSGTHQHYKALLRMQTNVDMMICCLVFALLVVVSRAKSPGPKDVIGKNAVTCITYDLLDWKRDFIASKGVYLDNVGVRRKKGCGLEGDCGVFEAPSVLELPLYLNNMQFEFSLSIWFIRNKQLSGRMTTIYSFGGCKDAILEIISIDDEHILWLFQDGTVDGQSESFKTGPQSNDWHHIVVSVFVSTVNFFGWADLYFDGKLIGHTQLDFNGDLPETVGPVYIGGNACTADDSHYYVGRMDSVSVARYTVTAREVRRLYKSRGQCIGE